MADDIFARLAAAQSDEERDWLLLEMTLARLEPAVQQAVWAAAIPHWFDALFLEALLDEADRSVFVKQGSFTTLINLSSVEIFSGRGYNIHKSRRELLRVQLWRSDPKRYRELSQRAANYCATQNQNNAVWRIETIYHRLMADNRESTDDFYAQGLEWSDSFDYYKLEALTRPILAAVVNGRLKGDIAAWAFYLQGRLELAQGLDGEARHHFHQALSYHQKHKDIYTKCIEALNYVHGMLDEQFMSQVYYEQSLGILKNSDHTVSYLRLPSTSRDDTFEDSWFYNPSKLSPPTISTEEISPIADPPIINLRAVSFENAHLQNSSRFSQTAIETNDPLTQPEITISPIIPMLGHLKQQSNLSWYRLGTSDELSTAQSWLPDIPTDSYILVDERVENYVFQAGDLVIVHIESKKGLVPLNSSQSFPQIREPIFLGELGNPPINEYQGNVKLSQDNETPIYAEDLVGIVIGIWSGLKVQQRPKKSSD